MLRRRMLIMLGVVLLIVLVLAGYKAFSIYTMIQGFSAPKPPISVAVATATERPWQASLPTVGTLKALQGVDLSLETDGTVVDLQFESGQKSRPVNRCCAWTAPWKAPCSKPPWPTSGWPNSITVAEASWWAARPFPKASSIGYRRY